jgi:hypothetical protein
MIDDVVQTSAADMLPPYDPATFWMQFRHDIATIKSVRLHFVEGSNAELVRVALRDAASRRRRAARDRARPARDG